MRARESAGFQAPDALPLNGDVLEQGVLNHDVAYVVTDGVHSPLVLDTLDRDAVVPGPYEAAIHREKRRDLDLDGPENGKVAKTALRKM